MQTTAVIQAERKSFDAQIAKLTEQGHAGKLAVVKDAKIHSLHATEDAAYAAALAAYGSDGIFLIARVMPPTAKMESVSWQFGVMLVTQG